MKIALLTSALLTLACGTALQQHGSASPAPAPASSPPAAQPPYHSMLVDSAAGLPACTITAEGWLIYLELEAKFQACESGNWVDISIQGPKGDAGVAGSIGATGAAGKDGTDKIASSTFCQKPLENTSLQADYWIDTLSSGDVFATADIVNSSGQTGNTAYYAQDQSGAGTATVIFTYDYVAPVDSGSWTFKYNFQNNTAAIEYSDGDVSGGKTDWSMDVTDCQTQTH